MKRSRIFVLHAYNLVCQSLTAFVVCLCCQTATLADEPVKPDRLEDYFIKSLATRALGPAKMGGRITALAVVETRPSTWIIGTAGGGVWKSVNRGTTWLPIFDQAGVSSIGDVAVSPSDPEVIWVGTGEANPRNSVSWGDGVHRSTDGGKTWRHIALGGTFHVGRIRVHPRDPQTAYVAALGSVWGPGPERGVFKTIDGGLTWRKVKFISSDVGFVDLILDPQNPEIVFACAYPVRRDAFAGGNPSIQCGSDGGIYRSDDGGTAWQRLTLGLPNRPLGRCGLDISRRDPRLMYAVVQSDKTNEGLLGQAGRPGGAPDNGGVFRSHDGGATWIKVNDLCPRPFYYGQIRIDPVDDQVVYVLGVALYVSRDGGHTFHTVGDSSRLHPDHHALWIDPQDSDFLLLGGDGGLSVSYDRGGSWDHIENLPIGQFYSVTTDDRVPYRVYGGMQDNGCWYGPSATSAQEGISNRDWLRLMAADGFRCAVDGPEANAVYAEAQFGRLERIDLRTRKEVNIRPRLGSWSGMARFNWNAPLITSMHDERTIYFGGNVLFRSRDQGEHWKRISPDLTYGHRDQSDKNAHSLTAVAESPRSAGLLLVGSDDGAVHISRDGGEHWQDLSEKIPALRGGGWVSSLECDFHSAATAFVSVDRHRLDDRRPYLYRTDDFGESWKLVIAGLKPEGPVLVVRASRRNRDLWFAGTEFGLYTTLDRGLHWHRVLADLPPSAIEDIAIQDREHELVIATHGRGLYIMNIAVLEQYPAAIAESAPFLFDVPTVSVVPRHAILGWQGDGGFLAPNPPNGVSIRYLIPGDLREPARIHISTIAGQPVADLPGEKRAGIHQATWGLKVPGGGNAAAAEYTVRLQAGDQSVIRTLRIGRAN